MKIQVFFDLFVPLVLLAFFGCQPAAPSPSPSITWWHINTDKPGIQALEKIAQDFQSSHPHVKITAVPVDNLEFKQKLQMELSAHNPPDLFATWGGGSLVEMAKAGQLRDITNWVRKPGWAGRINPVALEIYSWEGRVYGYPQDLGSVGFWYNSALLAKVGYGHFPVTWADFLTLVKKLKASGITPIALGIADHWPGAYYWGYLALRISGPGLFQDIRDGKKKFTDPALVDAARHLVELANLQPFQETALGDDFPAQSRIMGDGKAAIQLMGQWALAVQAQNADQKNTLEPLMKFAPFPTLASGKGQLNDALGGANGFSVGRNAPDSAIELLEFFNQPSHLQEYFDAFPAIPTNHEVKIKSPALQMVQSYLTTMSSFTLYPDQTFTAKVNAAFNSLASRILVGELSPEEACAELQSLWEKEQKK